jgi:hypothetical protein
MPLFGTQHRNHSFPPSFRYVQNNSSSRLSPPLPNIDDEPWAHFITPVTEDDGSMDYLDFSAGILTSSEVSQKKKKHSKFRPSNSKKWGHQVVNYHHGTFPRKTQLHGFVENRHDPWSHVVEYDIKIATDVDESDARVAQLRLRGRSKTRTMSGHRHSWREPSVDLFTVAEEAENPKGEVDPSAVYSAAEEASTISRKEAYIEGMAELSDINHRARL